MNVGVLLGLDHAKLSDVCEGDIHNTMICWWLERRHYVVDNSDTLTLRSLIKALRDHGSVGLAMEIEENNPTPTPSECGKHQ